MIDKLGIIGSVEKITEKLAVMSRNMMFLQLLNVLLSLMVLSDVYSGNIKSSNGIFAGVNLDVNHVVAIVLLVSSAVTLYKMFLFIKLRNVVSFAVKNKESEVLGGVAWGLLSGTWFSNPYEYSYFKLLGGFYIRFGCWLYYSLMVVPACLIIIFREFAFEGFLIKNQLATLDAYNNVTHVPPFMCDGADFPDMFYYYPHFLWVYFVLIGVEASISTNTANELMGVLRRSQQQVRLFVVDYEKWKKIISTNVTSPGMYVFLLYAMLAIFIEVKFQTGMGGLLQNSTLISEAYEALDEDGRSVVYEFCKPHERSLRGGFFFR